MLAGAPNLRFRVPRALGAAVRAARRGRGHAADHAFFRRVTLPIILVVAVLIGLVGAGIYWDVTRTNIALVDRQVRMARMAVAASVDELAYQQQSDAMWKPLVDKVLAPKLDLGWMTTIAAAGSTACLATIGSS